MKDVSTKIKMLLSLMDKITVPKFPRVLSRDGIRKYTTPGAGAGKGGGAGGAIKEAGGGLGKWGAAQEEGYFFNLAREQLKKIKQLVKTDEQTQAKEEEKK